eukprot:377885-Prorocentrum_minimum.AAC.1
MSPTLISTSIPVHILTEGWICVPDVPQLWNPIWSMSTVLTGLLSFMTETTPTTGTIYIPPCPTRSAHPESFRVLFSREHSRPHSEARLRSQAR